jgi:DNA polymerase-3 subunit delta'
VAWQRVRGHERLIDLFERVVQRDRLGHAYLFVGPAGVGKRLFAEELAKALLCEGPDRSRLEACDRCLACLLVAAGSHPDYFTAGRLEEKQELTLEVVSDLCSRLALKPARGRRKIAIVDDADDLNEEAANCFLKTLEEPPPGSLLILIGTSADLQLPTILSRSQIVRFAPLSESLIAELLAAHGVEDPALIQRLARLSGGSLGLAQALADPDLWKFRRELLQGLTASRIDSVALAQKWSRFVQEAGKEAGAKRRRAALVLRLLLEFLHDALRLRVGGRPRLAEPEDLSSLRALADRTDPETLIAILERSLEGDRQLDRYVQIELVLEALMDALGQEIAPVGQSSRLARTGPPVPP